VLRRLGTFVCVTFACVMVSMVAVSPAMADGGFGGVTCTDPSNPKCAVDAHTPAGPGGKGGGQSTGDGKCHNLEGQEIPCQRDGGWAGSDGCYYKPANLSADTIAGLGGQPSGKGTWYEKTCYGTDGAATTGFGGPVWLNTPPAVSPAILAQQARSMLTLPAVTIRVNPSGDQLVGLPTWLSLDPASWHPQSATASVPGVSVTATATPTQAVWSMGNGESVVCHGPGTPWRPGTDPAASSPDCGYRYLHSSAGASGGAFPVTVTITWQVTWAGAGQGGTIAGLTTAGAVQVRVAESQTVITP
jgi:hypothetical protein